MYTIHELYEKACYLHISIPYDKESELISFDDGKLLDSKINCDFVPPMLNAKTQRLDFLIDIRKGKLLNWKKSNGYLRMWAKVWDNGTYTLLEADRNPFSQIRGYVPHKLIPPEFGYDDYIDLSINPDGTIKNWPLNINLSDFEEEGESPIPIKTNKWHRAEKALWYIEDLMLNKEELGWLAKEIVKL